jgi:two-component system sensor histidine kinase KdpD
MKPRRPSTAPTYTASLFIRRVFDAVLAAAVIAATTAVARAAGANPTTVGFVYLIAVLAVAVPRGIFAGVVASLAGTACFNYFFLPPVGTWTISDPANWVALSAFLIASVVASRLVANAQRRAAEAEARELEVEALYDLSLDLFTATNRVGALGEAAGRALKTIGARGGGLVLFGDAHDRVVVSSIGPDELHADDPLVEGVSRQGKSVEVPAANGERDVYLPLALGGKTSGILVARGTRAERNALESVGRLVALAVERERFLTERVHLDALRESDALKTSLLRAVSHDLRTPMTAIRMGLDRLKREAGDGGRSAVEEVSRETERLSRRIDNLLARARLDAGTFIPHAEPFPAADLFRSALDSLPLVLNERPVEVSVTPETPDLYVDPTLGVEILANLLENAARVSPPGSPLELRAEASPMDPGRVRLDVLDRGPGVPAAVRKADSGRSGLGLEICRSLAHALGGTVALLDRPGGGTIARLELPAARLTGNGAPA